MKRADTLDSILSSQEDMKLSAKEIISIIRAARECNLKCFSLGDLNFELSDVQIPRQRESDGPESPEIVAVADKEVRKLEAEELLKETILLREAQLEHLAVTDPDQLEQLHISGELVDEEQKEAEDNF